MKYIKEIKYIMAFFIFIIIISSAVLVFDSISFENEEAQKIEETKEIQKFRYTILEYKDGVATVEGGKEFKVVGEAKNQMILKKMSDVYVNTSSNEIIKIEFQEYIR